MDMQYIKELEDLLIKAKDAYYNTGSSIMTDAEYDRKEEELQRLYPQSKLFQMVGVSGNSGNDVDLVVKAFSTDKALSAEELTTFFNRISAYKTSPIIMTTKMDGVSLILFYKNGILVDASTRGDGIKGTRCLDKILYIPSIPHNVPNNFNGQVRGELTISHHNFDLFNNILKANNEPTQANSRNSVSGLLNNKNMKSLEEKMALTSFNAFGVYDADDGFDEFGSYPNYLDQLDKAKSFGFNTVEHEIFLNSHALKSFINREYEALGDKISKLDTRADGVVFRLNSNSEARTLGYANKYINAVTALKFNPEYVLVALKDIEWSYGSGEITPVAIFDPVELDGAEISRCSMHSIKNMIDLDVQKPGDTFILVRSGSVVPRGYHRDNPKFNY